MGFAQEWIGRLSEARRQKLLDLEKRVAEEEQGGKVIFPPAALRYASLEYFLPEQTRAIVIGQDPYHGAGEACGLCFAVQAGVKAPPSLRNIEKELAAEYGSGLPGSDLSAWASQGVLLLNASLSVEMDKAGSHGDWGWQEATDALARLAMEASPGLAVMLWGNEARKKAQWAKAYEPKHCVLESAHPSPLSARRGFFGNGHFKKANEFLESRGLAPIVWHKQ